MVKHYNEQTNNGIVWKFIAIIIKRISSIHGNYNIVVAQMNLIQKTFVHLIITQSLFGVCLCGVVKARWCLHCFLIAKMPGLQCLPGANLLLAPVAVSTNTPSSH